MQIVVRVVAVGADDIGADGVGFGIAGEAISAVVAYDFAVDAHQGFGHGTAGDAVWQGDAIEQPSLADGQRDCEPDRAFEDGSSMGTLGGHGWLRGAIFARAG